MTDRKAYRVFEKSEDSDNGMGIVFAMTAAEARLKAWHGELDIAADAFTDLRARREYWADAYAETEDVPFRAYLKNGWWWSCFGDHCDQPVDIHDIGGVTDQGAPLCERSAVKYGKQRPEWAQPYD